MSEQASRISVPESVTVVDTDAHYTGHFEELVEYIDHEPYRRRFADAVAAMERGEDGAVSLGFWPKSTSADERFRLPSFWEGADRESIGGDAEGTEKIAAVMGDLSIDKILLLGNYVISFDKIKGDDMRPTVYANAYVDHLLDRVVDPDEGIYGTVPVPYHAPDEAAELIDRVAGERGIAAACFLTSNPEPPLGNRRYDVIYDALERNGLPALFHGGVLGLDQFYTSGYTSRLETHHLGFLWANVSQMTSIVAQGVPEKFPDLDIVFQESGIFYVPMMMYRMDSEYLRTPGLAPLLEKRPSEYMKEFYYGTQPLDEPANPKYFEYVIEMIGGADRLMYASDWPHGDYDTPGSIADMPFLSREEKAKILGGNAEAVFGI